MPAPSGGSSKFDCVFFFLKKKKDQCVLKCFFHGCEWKDTPDTRVESVTSFYGLALFFCLLCKHGPDVSVVKPINNQTHCHPSQSCVSGHCQWCEHVLNGALPSLLNMLWKVCLGDCEVYTGNVCRCASVSFSEEEIQLLDIHVVNVPWETEPHCSCLLRKKEHDAPIESRCTIENTVIPSLSYVRAKVGPYFQGQGILDGQKTC